VLGVDDFALRKRQTYGTILVDLERRQPVALLQERTADTVAQWLREHPGVEIISRDRGAAYAKGGTAGAPDALQVADRWHLLKNLGEALQQLLGRHAGALRQAARDAAPVGEPVAHPAVRPPNRRARRRTGPSVTGQQARQRAVHRHVRALAAEGWSVRAIARHRKVDQRTVRTYRELEQCVDGRALARRSTVEPYRAYAERRWAEGCTQVKQLWEELQAQGFRGSDNSVWLFTRTWPPPAGAAEVAAPAHAGQETRTPRQALWLLLQAPGTLEAADAAYREALCRTCPEVGKAATLAHAFGHLVRERRVAALDPWLGEAEASGVRELRRFALGLCQDDAAVRAALEQPWSQGQTEGQVTRLKLVKRQMYGRANFDLLRLRVLRAA
jgi:transposase